MIRFTREESSACGLIVVVVFVVVFSPAARAQATFTVLHRFQEPDAVRPWAGLIQGPDGTLYGTTLLGGINECGAVFQMAPDGSDFSFLYGFTGPDGCNPAANLMQGPDGTLYGTTLNGGGLSNQGVVFQLGLDGSFARLHSFVGGHDDGSRPYAGLIQASDGTLYGTTIAGGSANLGTIFQISPDGTFTLLYSFMGPDGANPQASLIQGFDGMLYGTTVNSGPGAGGTVFQIAPDGTSFIVLHSFAQQDTTDGAFPHGALIQGRDGTLYGTTYTGGCNNLGAIFSIALDGSGFALLHSFDGSTDGARPWASLLQGSNGTLYGMTTQNGSGDSGAIFQLGPDGTGFTTLYSLVWNDGSNPLGSLIQGPDGTLYGTTSTPNGTIFQLTLGYRTRQR